MNEERTAPTRVRITRLQEVQLPDLVKLDAACASMYYELGFDGAEVPVRKAADFVALTRGHNLYVAEADHVPAGFVAFRDEPPGIACLADISVDPAYQRFGIGTKLLDVMDDDAKSLGLGHVVALC